MPKKKNREINVFSASAIDLFASSLGVFILLVILIIPYYRKQSRKPPETQVVETSPDLAPKVEALEQKVELVLSQKAKLEDTVEQLKRELESAKSTSDTLQRELASKKKQPNPVVPNDTQIRKVEKELEQVAQANSRLKSEKEKTQKQLENLQRQLEALQADKKADGSFVAIVIKWATEKHDVDLIIKDPSGKTFDFKNRSFANHPGLFSLDSRTGPGAELWQSGELLAGTYTLTYKLYNTYGNDSPAIVNGTIFSKEGSIDLPPASLSVSSKREAVFKVRVSSDKKVSLGS